MRATRISRSDVVERCGLGSNDTGVAIVIAKKGHELT